MCRTCPKARFTEDSFTVYAIALFYFRTESGADLRKIAFRVVTREEAEDDPALLALMGSDHHGRYNVPNSSMVLFMYEVLYTLMHHV